MKSWFPRIIALSLTAVVAVASLAPRAVAQAPQNAIQPVAVVSIASVEEVLGDIGYLTESAGQGDLGRMVALLSGGYTVGVDKKKPIGMVVTIKEDTPSAIVFLPVKNLDAVLEGIKEQVGEPKDAGDGIKELSDNKGNPIYLKQSEGWTFISQKINDLTELPAFDPSAALGDLKENYTIAARINVANIPADMKKVAVAQLKTQMEMKLKEELENQPEAQRDITARYTRSALEQVTSLIEDTDHLTVGLEVDAKGKSTHLDFTLVARPDTRLAREMALLENVKSSNAGFLTSDAAVNFHVSGRMSEENIALYVDMLKAAQENAIKEIEKDEDIEKEEARQIAKEVVNALFDVGQKTVASGKLDGGAALFLTPEGKVNLVAGGFVKDAARLEESLKKLVEAAKNEPNAPQVTFDAKKHGDVRFHTLSLPIEAKEDEARKIFGDRLDVAVGFGSERFVVALGPNGIDTAAKILDASDAQQAETVKPMQFIVSLGPILRFAAAVKEDPVTAALAGLADQAVANDHISITEQSLERGVRFRLEIEEGVFKILGAAYKQFGGAGQKQNPNLF